MRADLRLCAETAEVAFGRTEISILYDWRLRECDFGRCNGTPASEIPPGPRRVPRSAVSRWREPTTGHARVAGLLTDLPTRWSGQRVMLIGHVATQRALEHMINGIPLEELTAADFDRQEEGWEYLLT